LLVSAIFVDPARTTLPAVAAGAMSAAARVASVVTVGVAAIELATTGTTRSLGVAPGTVTGVVTVTVGEVGGTFTPPPGGGTVTVGAVAVTVGMVTGGCGFVWGCRRVGDGNATVNVGMVMVKVGPVTVKVGVVTVTEVAVSPPPAGSVAVPVGAVLVGEVGLPPVDTVSVSAVDAAPMTPPANADPAHTPSTRSEIKETGARAPRRTISRTLPEIDVG
jgi:hypothetical protein